MNFDLDDEQRDLAAAAADFLTSTTTPAQSRALLEGSGTITPGREQWTKSGFATITIAESAGGGGGSVLDLAVVAEQAGRVLAGPSLVTAARAAVLLAGDTEKLAALAAGGLAVAVADGDGPVLDAIGADTLITLRDGEIVLLEAGECTIAERAPIDPTRGLADVTLGAGGTVVPGGQERWDHALMVGRVILAAEGLGAAARALEIGVEYAKQRPAFGRLIGSYQAVKHMLVDVYVEVEQLRSLVWWAAWAADHAADELPLASAAAKAAVATALEHASETLIQVHGGIGFTWEHDAHLFWRRGKVDRFLLGDAEDAYDTVAQIAMADAAAKAGVA